MSKNSFIPDVALSFAMFVLVVGVVFGVLNSLGEMKISRVVQSAGIPLSLSTVDPETQEVRSADPLPIVAPDTVPSEPVLSEEKPAEPVPVPEEQVALADDSVALPETPADVIEAVGPPEPVEQPHSMPDILGEVEVRRSDTFLVMLEKVYGHSRSIYRQTALQANGHLPDVNNLSIGDTIIFPLIPAPVDDFVVDAYWVRVASFKTLAEAFDFIRAWPKNAPRIKMIPYYREKTGFKVDVILKTVFNDPVSARKSADELVVFPVKQTESFRFSLKDTHFFSDPFFR